MVISRSAIFHRNSPYREFVNISYIPFEADGSNCVSFISCYNETAQV